MDARHRLRSTRQTLAPGNPTKPVPAELVAAGCFSRTAAFRPSSFNPLAFAFLSLRFSLLFSAGAQPILSPPTPLPGGGWRITWTSSPDQTYQLERAANDQLSPTNWIPLATVPGGDGFTIYDDTSPVTQRFYRVRFHDVVSPTYFLADPDHFVPLNTNGLPVEGGSVAVTTNGQLARFEFRPEGRSPLGIGQGFFLRFPNGARQVSLNGQSYLEFTNVTLGFGPRSPFQLASALTLVTNVPQRLPMGPVEIATLAGWFGSTNGLDLKVFGKFPLRLVSGTLEEGGLRRAQFRLNIPNLPLPQNSGRYDGLTVELQDNRTLRIPFYGEFTLPDGSPFAPKASIAADRPVWLELRANGEVALGGRAEVSFPDGPKMMVDFGLDDPVYQLQFVAQGLHWSLLSSLADLLPQPPAVPNVTNATLLNGPAKALRCLDTAYLNFTAAAAGAPPADVQALPGLPPAPSALAGPASVLQAWSCLAEVTPGPVLALAELGDLFTQSGQSAQAGRNLESVICVHVALQRAKVAASAAAASGFSLDPASQAALDNNLNLSVAAAIRAAQSSDAVSSLRSMKEVAACLLELKALLQQIGSPLDASLDAALASLLQRFATDYVARLGVQSNVFNPPGSIIAAMSRTEALDQMVPLLEVLATAQQLGVDDQLSGVPTQEMLTQLAIHVWQILSADLSAAETLGDMTAYSAALADVLQLVQLRESGLIANTAALNAAGVPTVATLSTFSGKLGQLHFNSPPMIRSPREVHVALQSVIGLLHRGGPGVLAGYQSQFQNLYNGLTPALDDAFNRRTNLTLPDLSLLLRAGMEHDELGDALALPPNAWKTTRLPLVVQQLVNVAGAARAYSDLNLAATSLLDEADRQNTAGNQAARRILFGASARRPECRPRGRRGLCRKRKEPPSATGLSASRGPAVARRHSRGQSRGRDQVRPAQS